MRHSTQKRPIVQLDYFTGEFIDEYPSLLAFAKDYGLHRQAVNHASNRTECIFKKLPKFKLLFIFKDDYERLFKPREEIRMRWNTKNNVKLYEKGNSEPVEIHYLVDLVNGGTCSLHRVTELFEKEIEVYETVEVEFFDDNEYQKFTYDKLRNKWLLVE